MHTLSNERILADFASQEKLAPTSRHYRLLAYLLRRSSRADASDERAATSEVDIAVDVFDRDASFDPQIDSIVRVETHRLRKRLETYNLRCQERNGYSVLLPAQQYAVTIDPVSGATPRSLRSGSRWIAAIALTALLAGALFVLANKGLFQPTPERFTPRVAVAVEPSASPVARRFASSLEIELTGWYTVSVVTADPEYKFVVADTSAADGVSQSVSVRLEAPGDKVLWARQFVLDGDKLEQMSPSVSNVVTTTVYREDILPKHYLSRTDLSSDALELYGCLRDIMLLNTIGFGLLYEVEEILDCSHPDQVESPANKNLLHSARSLFYYSAHMGYFETDIDGDLHQLAKQELQRADEYEGFNSLYYSQQIAVARSDPAGIDAEAVRRLLSGIELLLTPSTLLTTQIALTYGYYLGDWDRAIELQLPIAKSFGDKRSYYNYTLLAGALAEENFEEAAALTKRVLQVSDANYLVLFAAAACRSGDQEALNDENLREKGGEIRDRVKYRAYVNSLGYHQGLTDVLLSIADDPTCPLFDK